MGGLHRGGYRFINWARRKGRGWIWAFGPVTECMAGPIMLPETERRADLEGEILGFGPGDWP